METKGENRWLVINSFVFFTGSLILLVVIDDLFIPGRIAAACCAFVAGWGWGRWIDERRGRKGRLCK